MGSKLNDKLYNSCNSNANQNEITDDEPCPPPGLHRFVTGQTVSFDDGPNSPPFDRVVPGEGTDYSAPYQTFPSLPKANNANTTSLFNDSNMYNSSTHDFFDSYLRNPSANENESKVNQMAKNKYNNQFFPTHDTEKRDNYFQHDVSRLPANVYDNLNNKNTASFSNYDRLAGPPLPSKSTLRAVDNVQFDTSSQQNVSLHKPDGILQFENTFFSPQNDNEQLLENKEKLGFFPQNNYSISSENITKNEIKNHNPSSNRMAIEGSSDNISHSKTVVSSTPIQSPSYDYWYSNNKSSHSHDSRQTRDQMAFYGNKPHNSSSAQPGSSNMQFSGFNAPQGPFDLTSLHSKTSSLSSNNSNVNENSGYQHNENYNFEPKRNHFSNIETLDNDASILYDIQANNANKLTVERSVKSHETRKNENESSVDGRQLQKTDNRENYENDESDKEIAQVVDNDDRPISQRQVLGYNKATVPKIRKNVENSIEDEESREKIHNYESEERPISQRMVVGYNNNTIPRTRENVDNVVQDEDDREIIQHSDSDERSINQRIILGYRNNTIPRSRKNIEQDSKLNKQYSFDSSHVKINKIEPPLEQRMVVGETSSDAFVPQTGNRIQDDRQYDEEKSRSLSRMPRRNVAESVTGSIDKNRKKLPYDGRQDRRKIESDDEDYDEPIDRNYDDSPDRELRSYHDKHYRSNNPQRFGKRLTKRLPESSFTQSQDESYYDDDDDDYDNYRNPRRYYERKSQREQSYRQHNHDSYYHDDRKYRRPNYHRRYEDDSFYAERNSRPSSRSGSEYRSLKYSNQNYHLRPRFYEHLDHRRIPLYGGVSKLTNKDFEKWSKIRESDPPTYINWFRSMYPREYAAWYSTFFVGKILPSSSYQSDRRGSGHSGQSSINNDVLVTDEKLLRMNEQSMFKTGDSQVSRETEEIRSSPVKFTIPHVKGIFNGIGQLMVINACSTKDVKDVNSVKIDIYSLLPSDDPDWIEFWNFTGPFILGETHPNTISDFVRDHASIAKTSSEKLLYLLIDLIIKMRGVTDGIAISELLMSSFRKSQNYSSAFAKDKVTKQSNGSFPNQPSLSETEILKQYESFLYQGNRNFALDCAVKNKLWGHAFRLASLMGTKYYNNVSAQFDSSISTNNPLNTLYQFYSDEIPLAMTACSDEKWGDWRPHLAMILSNQKPDSELNRTAIITLGDSLACKDIFASHFCYLVAQVEFEPPNKPSSKFSLLSLRNNVDNFGMNTPNHAILLTEAYEFAKRLQQKDFSISSLLPYKYLLATRLIDYGKSNIALQYLESIALDLIKDPCDSNFSLTYNVLELSERIKYLVADTSVEKKWLADLKNIVDKRFNLTTFVPPHDHHDSYKNVQLSDQSYNSYNFQQQSLMEPPPLNFSQQSQQQAKFPSTDDVQQPIMFSVTSANYQTTSLPSPQLNQSYLQNGVDVISSSDVNDDVVRPSNNYSQPVSSDNQQNYYSPWIQAQQPVSISMHSRNNYFEDNNNNSVRNENGAQIRKPPSPPSQPVNKETETSIQENKFENGNNPGWLSGLFNKFAIRPKHQAILPDDVDKKLVWDKEKNCWVDKTKTDDESSNAIKLPPKTTELQTSHSSGGEQSMRRNQMPQGTNTHVIDQNRPFTSNTNTGYKLRGKGMKSNYVDVFPNKAVSNPISGMPSSANASMDTSNAQIPSNMNLLIPNQFDSNAYSKTINLKPSENMSPSPSRNQEMPVFFDPNQYKTSG